MAIHVYSTLTNDNVYTLYSLSPAGQQVPVSEVRINGGANLANKNFVTPYGTVTSISESDADMLMNNAVFQRHEEGGFVKIDNKEKDIEKVIEAANMATRDDSAPLNDAILQSETITTKEAKTYRKK